MYDQMEFDTTLDSERDLKDNVQTAVAFACRQLQSQNLPAVASRHEGYGIAAESWTNLCGATDKIKSDMKSFLRVLQAGDAEAVNSASSIYNSAIDAAFEAARLAAQADRIMNDLYRKLGEEKTPLEEMLEEEDDGFQEAEAEEEEE